MDRRALALANACRPLEGRATSRLVRAQIAVAATRFHQALRRPMTGPTGRIVPEAAAGQCSMVSTPRLRRLAKRAVSATLVAASTAAEAMVPWQAQMPRFLPAGLPPQRRFRSGRILCAAKCLVPEAH